MGTTEYHASLPDGYQGGKVIARSGEMYKARIGGFGYTLEVFPPDDRGTRYRATMSYTKFASTGDRYILPIDMDFGSVDEANGAAHGFFQALKLHPDYPDYSKLGFYPDPITPQSGSIEIQLPPSE